MTIGRKQTVLTRLEFMLYHTRRGSESATLSPKHVTAMRDLN